MAVDWLANNLYIMDSGSKSMIVCAVFTSICTSIQIPSPGTFTSVAVNPHQGQVACILSGKVLF